MSDWEEDYDSIRINLYKTLKHDELLCELLAVIHGDGGQYTDKVGLVQSVLDAEKVIENRMNEIDTLRNVNA